MLRVYIEGNISRLIFDAHDLIPPRSTMEIDHRCSGCGRHILYPIMARERDIQVMETLIEVAKKYLADNGVEERMFRGILDTLRQALAKKEMN